MIFIMRDWRKEERRAVDSPMSCIDQSLLMVDNASCGLKLTLVKAISAYFKCFEWLKRANLNLKIKLNIENLV